MSSLDDVFNWAQCLESLVYGADRTISLESLENPNTKLSKLSKPEQPKAVRLNSVSS